MLENLDSIPNRLLIDPTVLKNLEVLESRGLKLMKGLDFCYF
jgi:hypothetical protein